MNAGLEASEDYLKLWHCYLDYLRRRLVTSNFENQSEEVKETRMEEMRETFQKAINQIYDCNYNTKESTSESTFLSIFT